MNPRYLFSRIHIRRFNLLMVNYMGCNIVKYVMSILLLVFYFCGAKAQDKGDSVPDFRASFNALIANRKTYNQYNDSIFLIKEKDEWVSFFKRRAVKNHELFADNSCIIETIKDYFAKNDAPKKAYVAYEYAWETMCILGLETLS